jgi:hypothetical protein
LEEIKLTDTLILQTTSIGGDLMNKIYLAALAATLCAPLEGNVVDSMKNVFAQKAQVQPVTIRVLIAHDEPGVILETKGKYKIYNPMTKELIATRLVGKRKFMQCAKEGLKWGEEFPLTHQLLFVPEAPSGVATTIVNGKEYRGSVFVYNVNGKVSVVNEVGLEDYLSSLMPLKVKLGMHEECLAALVIAERTKAYYQAINPLSTYFAVDADIVGYHGFAVSQSKKPEGLDEAIELTKNMVMSKTAAYEGIVTPIPAYWSQEMAKYESKEGAEVARIPLNDVEELAKQGQHAAQILAKAFPQTSIQVIH